MKKRMMLLVLCVGLMAGCGQPKVDNTNNGEDVSPEIITTSLEEAFQDMGAETDIDKLSISSTRLNDDTIYVIADFETYDKAVECSGTIHEDVSPNELELWDIYADGKQGEHYYWLSDENNTMKDNSIRRYEDKCALYDIKTEEIIEKRADLPKGNLANINENELLGILESALLDIGYSGEIGNIDIESREMSSIYIEAYFYINDKHLAAEFTQYSDDYLEMEEISLYDNPDYHYWISPNITTSTGTTLHSLATDEEIRIEDLNYSNYTSYISGETSENNSGNVAKEQFFVIEGKDTILIKTVSRNTQESIHITMDIGDKDFASYTFMFLMSYAKEELKGKNYLISVNCGGDVVSASPDKGIYSLIEEEKQIYGVPEWFPDGADGFTKSEDELQKYVSKVSTKIDSFFLDTDMPSSKDSITLQTGMYIVGEDIPEGKYDIIGITDGVIHVCSAGSGYSDVVNEIVDSGKMVYSNVRLEDGYTVEIVLGGSVELQPK